MKRSLLCSVNLKTNTTAINFKQKLNFNKIKFAIKLYYDRRKLSDLIAFKLLFTTLGYKIIIYQLKYTIWFQKIAIMLVDGCPK